jgi:hypothetical protein
LENFYGDRYSFQLTPADCGGLCVEMRIPIVAVRPEDATAMNPQTRRC